MQFIIEIGNRDQRRLIHQELSVFDDVVQKLELPIQIRKIIVASNFDRTVNELQGSTNYMSHRGNESSSVIALAKLIKLSDDFSIVLSPLLFMEGHDSQTRFYVYFHEITHVIIKSLTKRPLYESLAHRVYSENLYNLFEEYYSDRFSFFISEKCFSTFSDYWRSFVQGNIDGFVSIITDQKLLEEIRREIVAFRLHSDAEKFLERIHTSFDNLSMSIVHAHAFIHQFPNIALVHGFKNSLFMNSKTNDLVKFLRNKYEEKDFDLSKGLHVISEYMTNFGIKLEDRAKGLYCRVLDI